MQCRNCGTEIADKAIVCYRCGAGTTDPIRKPVPIGQSRRGPSLIAGIVPLVLALAALLAAEASGYPRQMDMAAIVLACLGAMLLIARLLRRR
jgi:hypothetical protein